MTEPVVKRAVSRQPVPKQRPPADDTLGAGTPEAPVAPQGRSERATRAPGDMHEPRGYPKWRLQFEEEDHEG